MLTILIVARNAEQTIARAVGSCLSERLPMILIDDHSTDATAEVARQVGGSRLRVIKAPDG